MVNTIHIKGLSDFAINRVWRSCLCSNEKQEPWSAANSLKIPQFPFTLYLDRLSPFISQSIHIRIPNALIIVVSLLFSRYT